MNIRLMKLSTKFYEGLFKTVVVSGSGPFDEIMAEPDEPVFLFAAVAVLGLLLLLLVLLLLLLVLLLLLLLSRVYIRT